MELFFTIIAIVFLLFMVLAIISLICYSLTTESQKREWRTWWHQLPRK